MKNAVISIVIFGIMLIVMTFSVNYLNRVCRDIERNADKLEEVITNENWDEAYDISLKILDDWKKYYLVIPMFANHTELDNLNNEILKLTQYIKTETKDESLASTHVVKFYLNNIIELQKVNLQNIL